MRNTVIISYSQTETVCNSNSDKEHGSQHNTNSQTNQRPSTKIKFPPTKHTDYHQTCYNMALTVLFTVLNKNVLGKRINLWALGMQLTLIFSRFCSQSICLASMRPKCKALYIIGRTLHSNILYIQEQEVGRFFLSYPILRIHQNSFILTPSLILASIWATLI